MRFLVTSGADREPGTVSTPAPVAHEHRPSYSTKLPSFEHKHQADTDTPCVVTWVPSCLLSKKSSYFCEYLPSRLFHKPGLWGEVPALEVKLFAGTPYCSVYSPDLLKCALYVESSLHVVKRIFTFILTSPSQLLPICELVLFLSKQLVFLWMHLSCWFSMSVFLLSFFFFHICCSSVNLILNFL